MQTTPWVYYISELNFKKELKNSRTGDRGSDRNYMSQAAPATVRWK